MILSVQKHDSQTAQPMGWRGVLLAGCLGLVPLTGCSPKAPESAAPPASLAPAAPVAPPEVVTAGLDPALQSTLARARAQLLTNQLSAMAWGRYGQALDAADFGAPAEFCYTEARARDPLSPRWPHLLGLRQLREQPDAALENLDRAIRLSGVTNDASRLRRAQALIERGRWTDATNQLHALLSVVPGHPAARLELARASLALGAVEAVPALLAPCLSNPYTARPAHVLFGQARLRQGQADAAQRHSQIAAAMPKPFDWPDPFLREVQDLRLDVSKLAEQANALLRERRLPEAETVVSNLLIRVPDDAEGLLLQGRIRLQQRRCAEAEALFQRHLVARPNSPNGWAQLGMACYCQSHWAAATDAFKKATVLKPDFAQAHFNLGLSHSRQGDGPGAIASLKEALRCDPSDATAHVALAEEYLRAGDLGTAAQHVEAASALSPQLPKIKALRERLRVAAPATP